MRSSRYQPKSKPTVRAIRPEMLNYVRSLDYIPPLHNGKYGGVKAIAEHFNITLRFNQMLYNGKVSGYAYSDGRQINLAKYKIKKGVKKPIEYDKIIGTFCHELAHIFQGDLFTYSDDFTLSDMFQCEQEAEATAILLYKFFFPELKYNKKRFGAYYKEADVIFFYNYYKPWGYKNDLFKWLQQ